MIVRIFLLFYFILKIALATDKESGCSLGEWPGAEFLYCKKDDNVLAKEDVFWGTMEQFTTCYFECTFETGRQVSKVCYNGQWLGKSCKRHAKIVKHFWRRRRRSPPPPPPDTTPPAIYCPSSIYKTAPEHQFAAVVTWSQPTAYDSADGARTPILTSNFPSGTAFSEGTHTVSYSASDTKGNTNYCSFHIYVSVIRCPTPSISSPGTVQCSNGGAYILGTQCFFNCSQQGYRLQGKWTIECLYFGYWDFEYPKCVRIGCEHPGSISHCHVSSSGTKYGNTADYTCDSGYSLVGTSRRVCQENGTWSGNLPVCQENRCTSVPCRNGGTCETRGNSFRCKCPSGKGGELCEKDIEPALVKSCPSSQTLYTSTSTTNCSWIEPTWEGSTETNITTSSNYVNTSVTSLPVGKHLVKYDAVKHNNGLRSSCNITVDVRTNPCPPLNKSPHSALLCNGWHEEYYSVCVQVCEEGYTPQLGHREDTLYACTASGVWYPTRVLPSCVESPLVKPSTLPRYTDCMEQGTQLKLSETFILTLKNSLLNFLCDTDVCDDKNVMVKC